MNDPISIPNDSTGDTLRLYRDTLRHIMEEGSDLSLPMEFHFYVRAQDGDTGQSIARLAASMGFKAEVSFDSLFGLFYVVCKMSMIASPEAIIEIEGKLDAIARPFEGYIDGWGTFGNAPSA